MENPNLVNYSEHFIFWTYCSVPPRGPLLRNGYTPNSGLISNNCKDTQQPTIERRLGKYPSNRKTPYNSQTHWTATEQLETRLNSNQTVGNGVFYPVRPRVI
jgi:hypothetical protein